MPDVVTVNIRLEVEAHQDGSDWVARCPSIDVYSQGATREEALVSLRGALELWFESCLQRGVLDGALREAGFVGGRAEELPPNAVNVIELSSHKHAGTTQSEYIEISVPAYIAAQHLEASAPR